MRQVRPVLIGDATILVEVDDSVELVLLPLAEGAVSDLDDKTEAVLEKVGDFGDQISASCVAVYQSVQRAVAAVHPDEVTVEFGLMLGGEAGLPFVAKGKAEANVGITMTWQLGGDAEAPDDV